MKTIVLSDVHLDVNESSRPQADRFVRFLRQIDPADTERLILLGDLFDFWFEYKEVVFSGYFEVLRAFAALRDGGVQMHFVCGNHDFWAGRFLRDVLRFVIHPDSCTLDMGGRRVLFIHGDGLNRRDIGYRVYKRFARARPVIRLFGLLHPDWAMAIARRVSRTEQRRANRPEPESGSEVEPLREFARKTLARGDADVVMCGHSHYPVHEEYPTPEGMGLYINTGDWLWHESYVEWDEAGFRLRSFAEETPQKEACAQAREGVKQQEGHE